ncbi:MAG: 50S ribosomal protein L4 [Candidatus Berkelbacteria bacterium]|nr:MAG: 50S ribosomal protein L4 [Candidatus Berkelbacteria bacterium]QQG52093.1 MAG: 50S ribosomal protein L4 [Candidatus Berkelbacteria bacterium]
MTKPKGANSALIKQAVLAKLANKRAATSAVKTRGQVSGGGRKPWRQKGTGRARAGSSRSPIWVGGGKVFGPTKERNYKTRLPQKMQRRALTEILNTIKNDVKTVSSLAMKEIKTKAAAEMLRKLQVNGAALLITEKIQPELLLSTNNLPNVSVTTVENLSIGDFVSERSVVMEQKVFDKLFPEAKKAPAKPKATKKAETK